MKTEEKSEWVSDLVNMTCRNTKNNIVINFYKIEGNLIGKIKKLPMKVINEWAIEGLGRTSIKNTVIEAEIFFLKDYFKSNNIL
jgi:hypothetical protein